MSQNIASKLAAVAIAVVMNGVVLGGVCYLLGSHADAAPACAHVESEAMYRLAAVA